MLVVPICCTTRGVAGARLLLSQDFVVVGPSKLDGDFSGILYQVNGKTITYDCAPLH